MQSINRVDCQWINHLVNFWVFHCMAFAKKQNVLYCTTHKVFWTLTQKHIDLNISNCFMSWGRNMEMTWGHDTSQIRTRIPYINRSLSEWHEIHLCSLSLQYATVILYLNKTRLLLSIIHSLVKNKWLKLESRKPANVLFIYLQINCYWQYLSSE